jgi:hypothetical protein
MMTSNIDKARAEALARIEKGEKRFKQGFIAAAVVEVLFLAAFVALADFGNRTHILLLLSTIATYTIVGAGLFALGGHVTRVGERILKGVELLADSRK